LAAYAAAAISKGDPIRTGIQGFSYDIRTAILPFMFIFNTGLLLIDVTLLEGVLIFLTTTIGMLAFCSATQRFILVKTKLWETLALLLVAFTLLRPDFWLDRVSAPYLEIDGGQVEDLLHGKISGASGALQDIRIRLTGPDFDNVDTIIDKNTIVSLPAEGSAVERLRDAGLIINVVGDHVVVDEPFPGTPLFQELQNFDFYSDQPVVLDAVLVEVRDRPAKEWFYLPALLLLGGILFAQRQRYTAYHKI